MIEKEQKIEVHNGIGLMSGSSLDGLDIVFCQFKVPTHSYENEGIKFDWKVVSSETVPFSSDWKRRLWELPESSAITFCETHAAFGRYLAEIVNSFIEKQSFFPDFIASHGHTIFHFPDEGFTTQIGDGAAIAAITGITTIDNFRAQDIVAQGQGAPLAPMADKMLFPSYDFYLNLGGIANISCSIGEEFWGFDIGGCNQVLNALVQPVGLEYDQDGQLASGGHIQKPWLEELNQLPFFNVSAPKSLGNDWVQRELIQRYQNWDGSLEDKLHTACWQVSEQIALSINSMLRKQPEKKPSFNVLVTGGGAKNSFLLECIEKASKRLQPTVQFIIPNRIIVDYKEALLMALLGLLRIKNQSTTLIGVTGAKRPTVGGAIHQGWRSTLNA